MATFTASSFLEPAKAVHVGVMSRVLQYNHGATASSVGDIFLLAKIPHGARILDIIESHTTGATAQALDIGLLRGGTAGGGASLSALGSALAQATRNVLAVGLHPVERVSLSDSDPIRYAELTAKVASGSATTSLKINLTVFYTVDGS